MLEKWWKEGIVYQIYPRSFYDSNGDGIGDLHGIIDKIDYISSLGVNIIWLNPVYKSPNDDNGYDISDYQGIMDEFGTLEDWEKLLDILHKNNIKLIMDLVVNHTSDEHSWFIESRSSKDNPYRDYYIWRSGNNQKAPNNWYSVFGGSAWEYDQNTDEYFLHLFTKKQPDLNWENNEVRKKIYDMMIWWLDKGIDGFRMDVINMISKDPLFPDIPTENSIKKKRDLRNYTHGPRVHEYLKEMNREVLSKYDIMTVGECPATNTEEAIPYVAENQNELNMIFHFEHVNLDYSPDGNRWHIGQIDLIEFKDVFTKWHKALHNVGWNSIYFMNHDQPRTVSRYGNDCLQYRILSAKMLATFLLTMPGTPYIYQGDEIGMTNVLYDSIEDYRDIETLNYYNLAISQGLDSNNIMNIIHYRSRDNSRTPMQWDNTTNAGFSTGKPWIKVNPNYTDINVRSCIDNPDSILNYYKKFISIRKQYKILVYGDYSVIDYENKNVYAYKRYDDENEVLVLLNFSDVESEVNLSNCDIDKNYSITASNYCIENSVLSSKELLKPYEARLYISD